MRARGLRPSPLMQPPLHRFWVCLAAALLCVSEAARAVDQESTADAEREITRSMQAALTASAAAALQRLGAADGFLRNDRARIPLPENLIHTATGMRRFGMGRYPDQLQIALNRAAESAVSDLRDPMREVIGRLTFADMRNAVAAHDESVVEYLRRTTSDEMLKRFLPAVQAANRRQRVADAYQGIASRAAKAGLMSPDSAQLDPYVATKALAAVYDAMREEERVRHAESMRRTQAFVRRVSGRH
jgi:glycine/D-amino acid oxidase-like deaminating enzyme